MILADDRLVLDHRAAIDDGSFDAAMAADFHVRKQDRIPDLAVGIDSAIGKHQ